MPAFPAFLWHEVAHTALVSVKRTLRTVRGAKLRFKQRFNLFDPPRVVPYRGFGTPTRLELYGRVMEQDGTNVPEGNSLVRNVWQALERLESDEIPGALLQARLGERTWQTRADDEGFFVFTLEPEQPLAPGWHTVDVTLLDSLAGDRADHAQGQVLVPSDNAAFGVISDLDDTVVRSGATRLITMAWIMLTYNARTRIPFPGAAALYHALQAGRGGNEQNPIFYLSLTGWNLYDLFDAFMEHHGFPKGPTFMRDLALFERNASTFNYREHKRIWIDRILATYPHLSFVLIGDSGQGDPETYLRAVQDHPGRIRAVYLRDVSSPRRDREARAACDRIRTHGIQAVLAADSTVVAEHAAEHGFIPRDAVSAVRSERARQKQSAG